MREILAGGVGRIVNDCTYGLKFHEGRMLCNYCYAGKHAEDILVFVIGTIYALLPLLKST